MPDPISHIDQMGRRIVLDHIPKRIISLVPSQTELLYALGLNQEVIAQTIFCIHPHVQHQNKPRIGGTKNLNIEKIRSLAPDLIIGNKEENDQAQVEELMQEFPVWMSDIKNLEQALDLIGKIGGLTGKADAANALALHIRREFNRLQKTHASLGTCVYLIWRNPYMAAGAGTFINHMLGICGFDNLCTNSNSRYPELDAERLQHLAPQTILLSSEPFPFKQKHIDELQRICPGARIALVDGELFSWYGSRLLKSAKYLEQLRREFAK